MDSHAISIVEIFFEKKINEKLSRMFYIYFIYTQSLYNHSE